MFSISSLLFGCIRQSFTRLPIRSGPEVKQQHFIQGISQPLQSLLPHFWLKLAFPNLDDMPSHVAQPDALVKVTPAVSLYLVPPECRVRLRQDIILASFMPVPKTAVHEDNRPILAENNIRTARQPPDMYPITESARKKKLPDNKFRLRVAPAYPRHAPMPLLWSQLVNHICSDSFRRKITTFLRLSKSARLPFSTSGRFQQEQKPVGLRAKSGRERAEAPAIPVRAGHEANRRLRASRADPTALALSFSSESTMPPLGYIRFSV